MSSARSATPSSSVDPRGQAGERALAAALDAVGGVRAGVDLDEPAVHRDVQRGLLVPLDLHLARHDVADERRVPGQHGEAADATCAGRRPWPDPRRG